MTWKRYQFTSKDVSKGGKARAAKLSGYRRSQIARQGYLAMLVNRAIREERAKQEQEKAAQEKVS